MKKLVFLLFLFQVGTVHSDVPSIQDYKNKKSNNIYDSYIYGLESGIEWAYEHIYSTCLPLLCYFLWLFCPYSLVASRDRRHDSGLVFDDRRRWLPGRLRQGRLQDRNQCGQP